MNLKTRRILLLVALALSTIGVSQAQFRFGIKAGAKINHISWKSSIRKSITDNYGGFTVGLTTEFTVPVIGLGFDLSAMYTNVKMDSFAVGANETETQNYIDVPLHLKYKLSLPAIKRIIAPYIFTGPDFMFKFKGSQTFKTFQCAWDIGLGIELLRHLQIGAYYGFGINNIYSASKDLNIKTNCWTITAAYLF